MKFLKSGVIVCFARLSVTATSSLYFPGPKEPSVTTFWSVISSPCSGIWFGVKSNFFSGSVSFSSKRGTERKHPPCAFFHPPSDCRLAGKRPSSRTGKNAESIFGTNFYITQNKLTKPYFLGRDALNLVGDNQRARGKLVVLKARHSQAGIHHAYVVAVHVLQHDIETVKPRTRAEQPSDKSRTCSTIAATGQPAHPCTVSSKCLHEAGRRG